MEIYVRVLVRSNLTTYQNEYIYFHIQPKTFLLHMHHYHKKLNNIYHIIFINKISKITSLLNKKIEIQNESKPIVATSVSKAVT